MSVYVCAIAQEEFCETMRINLERWLNFRLGYELDHTTTLSDEDKMPHFDVGYEYLEVQRGGMGVYLRIGWGVGLGLGLVRAFVCMYVCILGDEGVVRVSAADSES